MHPERSLAGLGRLQSGRRGLGPGCWQDTALSVPLSAPQVSFSCAPEKVVISSAEVFVF